MSRLRLLCDFSRVPISYDFVVWLVRAKLEAQRHGADGLHIVMVPRAEPTMDGYGGHLKIGRDWGGHSNDQESFRFWHIVVPALQLAGATFEFRREPMGQFCELDALAHHAGALVEAARQGEAIPRFAASAQAREAARSYIKSWGRRVVTITARESTPRDARDTDGHQWMLVREWLTQRGWHVVWVPDTRQALLSMQPAFAIDLDLRLALYQEATLNLHVNAGPAHLCWYTDAPFIQFNCARPHEPWRAHWAQYSKLDLGDPLPWAGRHQVLDYGEAHFGAVLEAVEAWEAACAG